MVSAPAQSVPIHSTDSTANAPIDPFEQNANAIDKKMDEVWGSAFIKCKAFPLLTLNDQLTNPSLDGEEAESRLNSYKLELIAARLEIKAMLQELRRQQSDFNELQKKQVETLEAKLKSRLAALIHKTLNERRKEDEERRSYTQHWYS